MASCPLGTLGSWPASSTTRWSSSMTEAMWSRLLTPSLRHWPGSSRTVLIQRRADPAKYKRNPYTMGDERLVPTPIGDARISWFAPEGTARAVTVLGHGSATGVESADLQAVAAALPHLGVTVALVT